MEVCCFLECCKLAKSLIKHFSGNFPKISGNLLEDQSTRIGAVVANEALIFARKSVRLFQTRPLNTSDVKYLQFHIRFKFRSKFVAYNYVIATIKQNFALSDVTNNDNVIVQSSVNNGITWKNLQQIPFTDGGFTNLVHITLPQSARYAATTFRVWQATLQPGMRFT